MGTLGGRILDAAWPLVRRVVDVVDAERAHDVALGVAARGWVDPFLPGVPTDPRWKRTISGLAFPSPVWLAPGLDKDCRAPRFWAQCGFGGIEFGAVTPAPQSGNDKPRLFSYGEEGALVNRMGLPSVGESEMARRLAVFREWSRSESERTGKMRVPVGVNVSKNSFTMQGEEGLDFASVILSCVDEADWFTINLSCTTVPGLRDLQYKLAGLLEDALDAACGKPVFLKLSPDLQEGDLDICLRQAMEEGVSGFVLFNASTFRPRTSPRTWTGDRGSWEAGGLSGRPLLGHNRSKLVRALNVVRNQVPVIACGGIETPEQVATLLDEGCAAVQVLSAVVFQGPGLVPRLHTKL